MNLGRCTACGTHLRSPEARVSCPRGCGAVNLKAVHHTRTGKPSKCGAACRNATTPRCDCVCGGARHGAKAGYYVHKAGPPKPANDHGNMRRGVPPEIAALLPKLVAAAQKRYDDWTLDESGDNWEVGGGGICHLIADSFVDVLSAAGITAVTVSSTHEVHVYTVARLPSGVWEIDIPYSTYERGGGYSWTKIEGVVFEPADIVVSRLSPNPRDFKDYVEDWDEPDEPDEDDDHGDTAKELPPLGHKFEADLPLFTRAGVDPGAVTTGFDAVEPTLLRFRRNVPSVEAIRLSTIFAGLTIMTGIATAERAFACIASKYRAGGRKLPGIEDVKPCIDSLGLHEQRRELYEGTAEWAPEVRAAMKRGLRDAALRRHLYMHSDLPRSIGLAKLSFVLALSGNDVCCLDARILGRMFGADARKWVSAFSGSRSARALAQYEHVEAQFLAGNPFYRPGTALGKARCQWMSWESVGNPPKPATHSAWADVVQEIKPRRP